MIQWLSLVVSLIALALAIWTLVRVKRAIHDFHVMTSLFLEESKLKSELCNARFNTVDAFNALSESDRKKVRKIYR